MFWCRSFAASVNLILTQMPHSGFMASDFPASTSPGTDALEMVQEKLDLSLQQKKKFRKAYTTMLVKLDSVFRERVRLQKMVEVRPDLKRCARAEESYSHPSLLAICLAQQVQQSTSNLGRVCSARRLQ